MLCMYQLLLVGNETLLFNRYKLAHLVRTHNGADDEAYQCVYQCEDKDGIVGVRLSKELMKVAGRTLKQNITELGPKVLPLSEILLFAANIVARKVLHLQIP
jgi:3-ketoacyl-CoA synthase